MRSINYKLTDAKLKALKPKDRPYKVADGGGLFVRISPLGKERPDGTTTGGTKAWAYAYTFHGKPKEVGFGAYPEVKIKAARDLHFAARSAVAEGRDPAMEKKDAKRKAREGDMTFKSVSERWLDANRGAKRWVPRTAERIEGALRRDVWPEIGDKQLAAVTQDHIRTILKAKTAKHPTAASVIRSIIVDIYDTAISDGHCEVNPAARLTKVIKKPPVVHHLDLKESQLGVWWNALAACEGLTQTSTINAAKFIALTMCRKSEVLNATWGEIHGLDGDAPLLLIPAERMKMKRDHIVPLTRQAVAILQAQAASATAAGRDLANDEYIFTTLQSPKKAINHATLNALFNRIAAVEGCEFIRDAETQKSTFSPHGLRSSATTILVERGYPLAIVDLLLAHSARGTIASYNRAEQLPARRLALQFYADLIDSLAASARGDNVVALKRAA